MKGMIAWPKWLTEKMQADGAFGARLVDAIALAFTKVLQEELALVWESQRRARLQKTPGALFRALLERPGFRRGEQLGITAEELAIDAGVSERSVTRAPPLLSAIPELIIVGPGLGKPLTWQLGSMGRSIVERIVAEQTP